MRVVGGTAKGRSLKSVPGDGTRPILDRVKTALFDIIRPRIRGIDVLDLFGGTGSVGIEALSQGAKSCVFLDTSKVAVKIINENLEITGLAGKAQVRNADAFGYLRRTQSKFDLIYIAPPQYKGIWIEALQTIAEHPSVLKAGGLVIVQIDPKEYEEVQLEGFIEESKRKYGNTVLVFYEATLPMNLR